MVNTTIHQNEFFAMGQQKAGQMVDYITQTVEPEYRRYAVVLSMLEMRNHLCAVQNPMQLPDDALALQLGGMVQIGTCLDRMRVPEAEGGIISSALDRLLEEQVEDPVFRKDCDHLMDSLNRPIFNLAEGKYWKELRTNVHFGPGVYTKVKELFGDGIAPTRIDKFLALPTC